MIISNSGVNGVVVELATLVKERGHPLIAITSLAHSERSPPATPRAANSPTWPTSSSTTAAPYGDAVLPLPDGGATGAVSTITSALLAQLVVAQTVSNLLKAGQVPPIYLSANVPEGDAHNLKLEALYEGRIRRGA